eukprot:2407938-Alexandrium_andersonii.AAC.1
MRTQSAYASNARRSEPLRGSSTVPRAQQQQLLRQQSYSRQRTLSTRETTSCKSVKTELSGALRSSPELFRSFPELSGAVCTRLQGTSVLHRMHLASVAPVRVSLSARVYWSMGALMVVVGVQCWRARGL